MFGVRFPERLDSATRAELRDLLASLNAWLEVQHEDDGSHGDVTCDSITVDDHLLGKWYSVGYNPANFTAAGGGGAPTWGVAEGEQDVRYSFVGSETLWLKFRIATTDVGAGGGAGPTSLRFDIPFIAKRTERRIVYLDDAGTQVAARVTITAASSRVEITRLDAAAFTATAADNTEVAGELVMEV